MFGVFYQFNSNQPKSFNELTEEQQLVYNQTKEAFDLLSSKFNEGTSNVGVLGIVGTQFEKGAEKVEYVVNFLKPQTKF